MTVKELIEILKEYPENATVKVYGGEGIDGDWAELVVREGGYSEDIMTEED